jgi:1-deoxy-D-xylulose-5-phosphate reductoisomerase
MKNIVILGSTGSIGTQALNVIENSNELNAVCLAAKSNVKLLSEQARKYKVKAVCIVDVAKEKDLKLSLNDTNVEVVCGMEGLNYLATYKDADIVLNSVVGMAGLIPTISAIENKKTIALANKETLVCAGEIVMQKAKQNGVDILPVDSEHSAIFQCLKNEDAKKIKRIILTASGGPFFGKKSDELLEITKKEALKHPNWVMGQKITIDSATLMNKGLEVIEAKWLFDVEKERIKPLVHRQSIIHSMVEFCDNSIIAQLGSADMRIPISYALNYPERKKSTGTPLDFLKISSLTFDEPDYETFKCLDLAFKSLEKGNLMGSVLNGANEAAVELFLNDKIKFLDIAALVEGAMNSFDNTKEMTLENVIFADKAAREYVYSNI